MAFAQQSLEDRLKEQSGFERLKTLIELSETFDNNSSKKSRKYAKQAYTMSNNMLDSDVTYSAFEKQLIIDGLLVYAKSQYDKSNYLDAKKIMLEAGEHSESIAYKKGIDMSATYVDRVDSLINTGQVRDNFFNRTLSDISDINLGSTIKNSSTNLNASIAIKTGRFLENKGDTLGAIEQYEKAAKLMTDIGEIEKADELQKKITALQRIQLLERIVGEEIARVDDNNEVSPLDTLASISDSEVPIELLPDKKELSELQSKSQELERSQNYKQALNYYKEFVALQQKWERDSVAKSIQQENAIAELTRLKQESQIADLNIAAIQREKEAQVRLRNVLIIVASMILIFLLVMLFLYLGKKKKHTLLEVAYNDLDKAKTELEVAENRISKLLQQQVSPEIASALIDEKAERKKQFVAIMFLDIRGFTPIAEKMEPDELIEYQNKVFGFMIEIVGKNNGNINQFMGDGFMATFGAPISHGNDINNAYRSGVEILKGIQELNEGQQNLPATKVGIGIHAGDVVTGNVGTESRKQFSVTGNTVIIAARVEQLNKKYESSMIITDEVYEKIEDEAQNFLQEETLVKGRKDPISIHVLQ